MIEGRQQATRLGGAHSPDPASRYAEATQVAGFLEAEWSDFIFQDWREVCLQLTDGLVLGQMPVAPLFYTNVANLISQWIKKEPLEVKRFCDVGAATGRTVYELANRIESIEHIAVVEPATCLAEWARRLLVAGNTIERVPSVHSRNQVNSVTPSRIPRPLSLNVAVEVHSLSAEEFTQRSLGNFDLVTCLNVIDRVGIPKRIIDCVTKLTRLGGIAIISSPLAFDERLTPDRSLWVDDIKTLFDENEWSSLAETNLSYGFRRHKRERIEYISQVVCKKRR